MKRRLTFFLAVFTLLLQACGDGTPLLPKSTGREGDLLLVVDDEFWKDNAVGNTLKQFFQQEFTGLPQVEPTWKLSRVSGKNFNKGFIRHRSILMAVIRPEEPGVEPFMEWGENVYAQNQLVCRIVSSDPGHWLQFFESRKWQIHQRFREHDMKTLKRKLAVKPSEDCMDTLRNRMGVDMYIDYDFYTSMVRENLTVFSYEAIRREDGIDLKVIKGLALTRVPYTDVRIFTRAGMEALCDSITAQVYQGENPGSVMMIEPQVETDTAYVDYDGRYAMELRGLWRMSAEMRGGPFLAYAVHDSVANNILFLHGFIYSPGIDKREGMLRMEAMLRSARW